ncbi:sacsin like HSP90 chaperone domain [Cryptosporidium sp. chipmunk genotype I]|uniref:sacsin like HSP90 chaperone domain n=1 Tax=Cryptosporidium sp. chipmunk genotype I TaxID=1280935 RepID=UPI003519FA99|nr:sacsin like HSP90 chaperone domain [Cryptosporidium sp. chipmunk genotype I]
MQNEQRKKHIQEIRQSLFVSNKSQRDRQDRSIGILSNELYSSFGRVLLELLQNADDSNFNMNKIGESIPQVYILLRWDCLVFHINEEGMTRENIESVCDIGNSSKKNSQSRYFTGEKGIGYRSVFKITDNPCIFSGGYSIKFSSKPDEEIELSYIVPKWIEESDFPELVRAIHSNISLYGSPWRIDDTRSEFVDKFNQGSSNLGTLHYLPFEKNMKQKFSSILSAIHDTFVHDILLFLRNIKSIVVDVEPRKDSDFCSLEKNTVYPLLRRRLTLNDLVSVPDISQSLGEVFNLDEFKVDILSSIKSFRFAKIEITQFDDDDLDLNKGKLLRESLISSKYLIVDWEIPILKDQKLESSTLRDRATRSSTVWSIALPLFHSNLRLEVDKGEPVISSSSFSLGSSTFGKHKRVAGKLFCTFPLSNRIYLPFHVNIQDLILTANREDIMADNIWNSAILDVIFKKQIPHFVASMINPTLSSSTKSYLINQRYSVFMSDLLTSKSLPLQTMQGSNFDSGLQPFILRTSELVKLSWLPPKLDDQTQSQSCYTLSSVCIDELGKKPVFMKIDGSFCDLDKVSTNIQFNDLCSKNNTSHEGFCVFCNLHWNFLYMLNVHMRPVLHPIITGGNICMHFLCLRPLQMLQVLVAQIISSYSVKNLDILEIFSKLEPLEFLESISDEELLILYSYLFPQKLGDVENLEGFERLLSLPIIPTRKNDRISMEKSSMVRVYISDESFDSYFQEHGLQKYSEIIGKVCPFEFFDDRVYRMAPTRIRSLLVKACKIEKITPSIFFKLIAENVDALLEKGWENAINSDIQKLLLKITPLAIEEASIVENDNRFLIKLPIVVQTYSPSFLKALLYNKDLPKSYASEEELLNKNKLARCSNMIAPGFKCTRCKNEQKEVEVMVYPTSVALRMSQVSKSLTSLMLLHSSWERSNKFGSKQYSNVDQFKTLNSSRNNLKDKTLINNSYESFEYKGLTIVPPLWPPLVEWVFPKVSDRFHFVEISSDYIVHDPSNLSENDKGLAFRIFTNKFINLLEQWYVGCNFDRLPPKTDASPLSWMVDRNTYPISSSHCFYCKHLIYVMRAGAVIQIANEYSRRSYSSSFLNEILSSYPWIPVSLYNDKYFSYYMSQINKEQIEDCDMADFSEDLLLSRPSDLFIPKINKNLDGIIKHISQIVLNLLPVTLRNGYKNPKSRENNETCSAHYALNRTEEDIGNESKLISETLEEVGVTTQISSISLIRILRDYKRVMSFRDKEKAQKSRQVKFKPSYGPDLNHIIELAVFGFGITKEKLFVSDWWPSLMDEWSNLDDNSLNQNLQSPSDIEIISDIYHILGHQADFDISMDIKKVFYKESLLYIPLMKSTLYNWVPIDYNNMVWSDPYDFFHGTFIVLSKFINKSKINSLRPFFLSLVSEQPIHHHYAYLWLRECPNLLKDESKEGKIKFESFINISINKFLAVFQKMGQSKKNSWWIEFLKSAKIPIKGMYKFMKREYCCVENLPIGSLRCDSFQIPLAISSSPSSQFFYKDILKLKTLSECYRITYKVNCSRNLRDHLRFANKGINKMWLTLEFWGILILLFKHKSLDIYLSIMRILEEKKTSDGEQRLSSKNSNHSVTDCEFCVSESEIFDQISNSYEFEPLSVSERFSNMSEGIAYTIANWLISFVNTYEVEVDDIELKFVLNINNQNLPKTSRKKIGVLYRQVPNKNSASILFVNKSVDKTNQLKDLYALLLDPLKGLTGLNSIINIDLYELLILSSSQRLLLLSKHVPVSDDLSGKGECFTMESVVKEGFELLKKCSRSECLLGKGTDIGDKSLYIEKNDLLSELSIKRVNNKVDVDYLGNKVKSDNTRDYREMSKNSDESESNLDSVIKEYIRRNPLSLGNTTDDRLTIEEITKMVGFWGEKVSFEAIIPNAISRKLSLKSVDHSLIEDYLSRKFVSNYIQSEVIDLEDFKDWTGIEDMKIEDNSTLQDQQKNSFIKCKVKCFKESDTTTIKLIWLNSLNESFFPCDFILLREYYSGEDFLLPQNQKQQVLALIEVKTTKLPIWQFNISGNELLSAKKVGDKFKLLLIKDAGSSESQWTLIDNVEKFIQERCMLVNGVFQANFGDFCDLNSITSGVLENMYKIDTHFPA